MSYSITYTGYTIYDPRGANEIDKLVVTNASLNLAVNSAGSLTFEVPPDHPYYDKLTKMSGLIEVTDDGVPIFRGRIVRDTLDMYGNKTIEAEGQLACLNDSVVAPYSFPEDFADNAEYKAAATDETGNTESKNVVQFWLKWLLEQHNSQVTRQKRSDESVAAKAASQTATETTNDQTIKLGTVTVQDPNNYISRSNENYSTTWDTITEKLSGSSLGGYLLARYESDGTYLDYVADLPLDNVQTVEFASNLLDLELEADGSEFYTAILPVGADGLTIADDNNSNNSANDHVLSGNLASTTKIK